LSTLSDGVKNYSHIKHLEYLKIKTPRLKSKKPLRNKIFIACIFISPEITWTFKMKTAQIKNSRQKESVDLNRQGADLNLKASVPSSTIAMTYLRPLLLSERKGLLVKYREKRKSYFMVKHVTNSLILEELGM
jgi:hypothetical protein